MWNIVSISVDSGSHSSVLFGGQPGKEIVSPTGALGPEGSVYILALPGLGYMKLTDVGGSVSGPGDWSVQVSGSSTNWFYRGGGQASISINSSGQYTISGGANTISGKLTPF
ncbi:hypothetical protein M422DRAFT_32564 [Sphaerobolus stellatus SS14]|uniref:Uncharacterized protein n=1 Tax=Sphaerobolus stellatus (strain SS14) TaxID=990650 RepID=A0A0C9UY76_SPHS4|nr:hypothetical protein M422DRAFT_69911 [Sphaerobolus stellatus SS14]KIJ39839.1 hypothetical protein M422DRAFT_32564 [Sphaerobolus stellatus SS14]